MNKGIKNGVKRYYHGKVIAAKGKQMELKMQEEGESDIDLGYIGSYSKMRCTSKRNRRPSSM